MTALVLSGSYMETNKFAQQQRLGYGIRHVVSADQLASTRPTSIHILPSFHTRRDVHALRSALKRVQRRVAHVTPIEYDRIDGVWVEKGSAPTQETSHPVEETPAPAPDTSKDAVPGQIPIEEAIGEVVIEDAVIPEAVQVAIDADVAAQSADADDLPEWLR